MGVVNNGNQIISYSYEQEVTSRSMNKLTYGLMPPGIYGGGELTRTSDVSVSISPAIVYYRDTANALGVKIEITENANLTVTNTKPYVVGRFTWIDDALNFMDFVGVSYEEITATDIVFGRLIFNGAVLTSEYDYSRKSWASTYYTGYNQTSPPFKVIANDPYDDKVTIMPGRMFINGQLVEIAVNTLSPAFTLPAPIGGKTDIVALDNNAGNIVILSSGSTTPAILSNLYYPLAFVSFPSEATEVRGSYVSYLHPALVRSPAFTSFGGTTVGNETGNIPINNGALCNNLNAQYLDGMTPTSTNTPSTLVSRDADGNAYFTSIGISKPNWILVKQKYTGTPLSNTTSPRIASFSESSLAIINNYDTGTLEHYSMINSLWTLDSPALALSLLDANNAITSIANDEVCIYYNSSLQSYTWTTSWATSSTALSLSSLTKPTLCALTGTRVALTSESGSSTLSAYSESGGNWSLTGNALSLGNRSGPKITALSASSIAYFSNDGYLRAYSFDGTDWTQTSSLLITLVNPTAVSVTTLNSTDVVVIDNTIKIFRVYRLEGANWILIYASSMMSNETSNYEIQSLSGTDFIYFHSYYNILQNYKVYASMKLPGYDFI